MKHGDWVKRWRMKWWHRIAWPSVDGVRADCGRWLANGGGRSELEARTQLSDGQTTLPERFRCPDCNAVYLGSVMKHGSAA